MRRFLTLSTAVCLSALLVATLAAPSLAGKGGRGGKGAGGGGGGDTPPVAYKITWLNTLGHTTGQVMDMNENGDIVGYVGDGDNQRAYLNTEDLGAVDLNVIMNVAALDDGGWIATAATGINELGEITGRVVHNDGTRGVFLYSQLRSPMLEIIALDVPPSSTVALINNLGDVVFHYDNADGTNSMAVFRNATDSIEVLQNNGSEINGIAKGINDQGQILGQYSTAPYDPFVFTPQTGDVAILKNPPLGASSGGFSNSGDFVGERRTSKRNIYEAFRYSGGTITTIARARWIAIGQGINERGDVCGRVENDGFYFSDRHGLLNLTDLVMGSTLEDLSIWDQAIISPQCISTPQEGATIDFGMISGIARVDGEWRPFLLTPEEPPSN